MYASSSGENVYSTQRRERHDDQRLRAHQRRLPAQQGRQDQPGRAAEDELARRLAAVQGTDAVREQHQPDPGEHGDGDRRSPPTARTGLVLTLPPSPGSQRWQRDAAGVELHVAALGRDGEADPAVHRVGRAGGQDEPVDARGAQVVDGGAPTSRSRYPGRGRRGRRRRRRSRRRSGRR